MTQLAAAVHYDVPIATYRSWETGAEDPRTPEVMLGRLEPHEECWLLRLREKKTLLEVSEDVNLCGFWVSLMEKGKLDCKRLVEYWRRAA